MVEVAGTTVSQGTANTLAEVLVMFVSPVVVWLLAKLNPPTKILPAITPLVGLLIGWGMNKLGAQMSPGDMAQAGAVAVCIREVTNQWVTKELEKRRAARAATPGIDLTE